MQELDPREGWTPRMLAAVLRGNEDANLHTLVAILRLVKEIDRRDGLIARLTRRRGPLFENALRVEIADVKADTARRYHREQGLTLAQTAKKMGTSVPQVCRWLRRPPTKY
jgi:hypothetical protein